MSYREKLEEDGFAIVPGLFSNPELRHITPLFDIDPRTQNVRRGGTRDVLDHTGDLRKIAEHISILNIVGEILGQEAFIARATLFDKTPDANWKVPWHQDVTIAVRERLDTPGYGPWSVKAGVVHVQPPGKVLERMLTVRIHLDPCPATNGALRVMPGTHRLGRLNQNDVGSHVDETSALYCECQAGDALLMRPMLLHASSSSAVPSHRRVLHFDYATGDLDGRLRWRMHDYSRSTLFQKLEGA